MLGLGTCLAASDSFKQGTGVSECLEADRAQNSAVKRAIVGLGLGLLPQVPSEACFHTERGTWNQGATALKTRITVEGRKQALCLSWQRDTGKAGKLPPRG